MASVASRGFFTGLRRGYVCRDQAGVSRCNSWPSDAISPMCAWRSADGSQSIDGEEKAGSWPGAGAKGSSCGYAATLAGVRHVPAIRVNLAANRVAIDRDPRTPPRSWHLTSSGSRKIRARYHLKPSLPSAFASRVPRTASGDHGCPTPFPRQSPISRPTRSPSIAGAGSCSPKHRGGLWHRV